MPIKIQAQSNAYELLKLKMYKQYILNCQYKIFNLSLSNFTNIFKEFNFGITLSTRCF